MALLKFKMRYVASQIPTRLTNISDDGSIKQRGLIALQFSYEGLRYRFVLSYKRPPTKTSGLTSDIYLNAGEWRNADFSAWEARITDGHSLCLATVCDYQLVEELEPAGGPMAESRAQEDLSFQYYRMEHHELLGNLELGADGVRMLPYYSKEAITFDPQKDLSREQQTAIYAHILPPDFYMEYTRAESVEEDLLEDIRQHYDPFIRFAWGVKQGFIRLSDNPYGYLSDYDVQRFAIDPMDFLTGDGGYLPTLDIFEFWEMDKWIHLLTS